MCSIVKYKSSLTAELNIRLWRVRLAGRGRMTGNHVTGNCSRVRIPDSPPKKGFQDLFLKATYFNRKTFVISFPIYFFFKSANFLGDNVVKKLEYISNIVTFFF